MNNSLLIRKMVFRTGLVLIKSDMDIQSLGKIISQKIFEGLSFGGLDQYIRDEIPAIYVDNVLGCRVILQGFPGDEGYNLVLEESAFPHEIFEQEGRKVPTIDLSGNLYWLLQGIEGISVFLE